jgi:hypothetical protein
MPASRAQKAGDMPDKVHGFQWVRRIYGNVTVAYGIVTDVYGFVTTDSGRSPKSVTMKRNERSRSSGISGHDQAERAVTLGRNTHLNAVDAAASFDRRYVVVAPEWAEEYCKTHDVPYLSWDFERLNDRSMEIAETLKEMGVDVAIPLFEETVEWAGAINSVLMDKPRLFVTDHSETSAPH